MRDSISRGQSTAGDDPHLADSAFARPHGGRLMFVDTQHGIEQVAELLRSERTIGLDTETAFYEEGKGKLCLIQLHLPAQNLTIIIDPVISFNLEQKTIEHRNLAPLKEALEDESIAKIAHSGGYDKAQFADHGIEVKGIIDTQHLVQRIRPDLPSKSLKASCKYILGIDLDKGEQLSNWLNRPLSPEQLSYAALDAVIVVQLHAALCAIEEQAAVSSKLTVEDAMRLYGETADALNRVVAKKAPAFFLLDAKVHALSEAIRESTPPGGAEYASEYGRVFPGELRQEIDRNKVAAELLQCAKNKRQRISLSSALAEIAERTTTRKEVEEMLAAIGIEKLGFEKKKELKALVDSWMCTPKGEIAYNFEPKFSGASLTRLSIDRSRPIDDLLRELRDAYRESLSIQASVAPEIPLLRLRMKLLEERVVNALGETNGSYQGEYGSVVPKKRQRRIDIEAMEADLRKRMVGELTKPEIEKFISSLSHTTLSWESVKELCKRPEFAFLCFAGHEEREALRERVSVPGKGYNSTRIYPIL